MKCVHAVSVGWCCVNSFLIMVFTIRLFIMYVNDYVLYIFLVVVYCWRC